MTPLRLIAATARGALAVPDRLAHIQMSRDLNAWIRIQFLGVVARSGIADALHGGATAEEIVDRCDVDDVELLSAVLDLGVALGELRGDGGRYVVAGRRLRAVLGTSNDLRGLVEEVVAYDDPVYAGLVDHLRGAPQRDYLAGAGDAIARVSLVAEPALAPTVRSVARSIAPARVLDVGCGSGVYLRHVLEVAPRAFALGIDRDPDALALARKTLAPIPGTADLRHADLDDLSDAHIGSFDLVLLMQNIYYWPPESRTGVLRRLRALTPDGVLVVSSAAATSQPVNRHLDLVLRVTKGSWRLPTAQELQHGLREAGFQRVRITEPIPRSGVLVAVAS